MGWLDLILWGHLWNLAFWHLRQVLGACLDLCLVLDELLAVALHLRLAANGSLELDRSINDLSSNAKRHHHLLVFFDGLKNFALVLELHRHRTTDDRVCDLRQGFCLWSCDSIIIL